MQDSANRFTEGYNCAQSVLLTPFKYWNGGNELIPKIATAFGGGIGRCGYVCGALTCGIMALGVRYVTGEPSLDKRLKAYEIAQKFYKRFEKRNGSILCRELIGYDFSNLNSWRNPVRGRFLRKNALASLNVKATFFHII